MWRWICYILRVSAGYTLEPDAMRILIEDSAYYDIPEVVKMLNMHKKTVYIWIRQGKLKVHKLGRKYLVSGKVLRRFIESH